MIPFPTVAAKNPIPTNNPTGPVQVVNNTAEVMPVPVAIPALC